MQLWYQTFTRALFSRLFNDYLSDAEVNVAPNGIQFWLLNVRHFGQEELEYFATHTYCIKEGLGLQKINLTVAEEILPRLIQFEVNEWK